MADVALRERLLEVLREAREPLTIGEIATRMGVSRPTAAKYVDICEAAQLVESGWFATARQIALRGRGGRKRVMGKGAHD